MAALTRARFHKELRWNLAAVRCLRRTRKEWTIHTVAFIRLRLRRQIRILNMVRVAPSDFSKRPGGPTQRDRRQQECSESGDRPARSGRQENDHAKRRHTDVRVQKRS